jgi:drug/metabolite transporter (DMT)-like permease
MQPTKPASTLLVIVAFATVYLVWGSTYFFIQKAIQHLPPMILGIFRFIIAGLLMLGWCAIKKENISDWKQIRPAIVTGVLLLFIGNGAVIWSEKTMASSLAAVLVSAAPLWFVLLDKSKWKENLTNKGTVTGLIIGFAGVILLFSEQASLAFSSAGTGHQLAGLIILIIGSISWSAGSLYSKYKSTGSATVNTAWQMIAGGIVFIPFSLLDHEWTGIKWSAIPMDSWLSLGYLIVMGSLAAYSAYVWLLQVRPATQVSTYAYVNPVVAVLLGVFFAHEKMSLVQIIGLAVILGSVLLINAAKYKKSKATPGDLKPILTQEPVEQNEPQKVRS